MPRPQSEVQIYDILTMLCLSMYFFRSLNSTQGEIRVGPSHQVIPATTQVSTSCIIFEYRYKLLFLMYISYDPRAQCSNDMFCATNCHQMQQLQQWLKELIDYLIVEVVPDTISADVTVLVQCFLSFACLTVYMCEVIFWMCDRYSRIQILCTMYYQHQENLYSFNPYSPIVVIHF